MAKAGWWAPPAAVVWLAIIVVLGLLIYLSRDFVMILLLSALLAYLLNPLVKLAESALIKRHAAVAGMYAAMTLAVLCSGYFLYPRLISEVQTATATWSSLGEELDEAIDAVQGEIIGQYPGAKRFFMTREFRNQRMNAWIESQAADLPTFVGHVASLAFAAVLIPFFSFFFLRDSRMLIQALLDRTPAAYIETSVAIWREVDRSVGHYLRGLALEGIAIGVLAGLGLWLLGIQYPLLLGVLSGAASVVPYLGPVLGGGSALIVALIQFKSLGPLASILLLYVCIKLLDIFLIQPLAVGHGKEIHPALLIASIIIGGHALGVFGMIVAVPTVTIVQRIFGLVFRGSARASWHLGRAAAAHEIPPFVC